MIKDLDAYGKDQNVKNLRSMAKSIHQRHGFRQSSKYYGKRFPSFKVVAAKAKEKASKIVLRAKAGEVIERGDMLQCLLVSCQCLIPPMRGKPFWSLSLRDEGNNSMVPQQNLVDGSPPHS